MRLFVAADVPREVKDAVERDVVEPLRGLSGAKWSRPEGRHLTLAFLGEVDEARIEGIGTALAGAAARHAGFEAAFDAVGGFPNLGRPRVLWLGIGRGRDPLVALQADVACALEPLGFPAEARAYHPHFTLARFPKPSRLEVPDVHVPADAFAIAEVVLFRSQLHPKGARYSALRTFALS